MRIDVIQDMNRFRAVEQSWDEAVSGIYGRPHPFFSHFWFASYYQAFLGDTHLFAVTARDESGRMRATLPMVIGRRRLGGIPLKEARLIAGDHSHINGLVVSPDDPDLVEDLLERIWREGVDLVYLEDLAEPFSDGAWWDNYRRSRKLSLEVRQIRSSPYIPITGKFEEYRKTMSKKFRELLNNHMNRINRSGGYEIRTFEIEGDVEAALTGMHEISTRSWQGREGSGLFSTPQCDRFYSGLIAHAMKNGYGRVYILYFAEKPAAFELHLFYRATEYCLKAEYSQDYERISPGAVLDQELVKRAFGSDIETYDLLGYADTYKLRWTKHTRPYNRYFLFNRTAAGKAAYALFFRLGNRLRNMGLLRRLKETAGKS